MKWRGSLKFAFYVNLSVLTALLGYKIYLNLSAPEFDVLHSEQIERIDAAISGSESFSGLSLRNKFDIGDAKTLVSVSRLSNEKNIDFILDAIVTASSKTHVPFSIFILGEGHEHQRLQKRIETMGLADIITLVGSVPPDEIVNWCQLADIFVFASRSETQGMVILEAMSAGLPVVALRSSGIDDVVKDGINGYKTSQHLDHWSDCVVRLLEHNEVRTNLGENARKFARDFSVEHFADRVRHIYAQTFAQRGRK
jgi:glycosyltransferase involved in cell wall biosynthesis